MFTFSALSVGDIEILGRIDEEFAPANDITIVSFNAQ